MGREGSDEVQFSRVPGGVQEPRVHFRLRAHLASTPRTSRIARLTTPPSGSTFSSLPPALSLSEPPSLALNLPFSVQTSYLTSMAEEGFDFNACIYNAMLVSPHLSFLVQERGLHSADLISFLVELSFHVNGKNMVKDLANLGLIKLQQGFVVVETNSGSMPTQYPNYIVKFYALKAMLSPDFSLCLCLIPERVV
ncbi:hypothetical protein DVH24_021998 [Malus domestica]|uniref:Uncharacterized protein n=1 Tax=Malus domestica TaxID=3750 RepID=A0A498IWN6_MALDO|nr:hypothetical protein DVH24_021998 [Malus domestica]